MFNKSENASDPQSRIKTGVLFTIFVKNTLD